MIAFRFCRLSAAALSGAEFICLYPGDRYSVRTSKIDDAFSFQRDGFKLNGNKPTLTCL